MLASAPQLPSLCDRTAKGVSPRLEGLAALAVSLALYAHAGFSWAAFALFLLAPDLRIGAAAYNLTGAFACARRIHRHPAGAHGPRVSF